MKTQTFGSACPTDRHYFSAVASCHIFLSTIGDYIKKRNNLESNKGDPPFDGKYTWIKGRIEGNQVYGEKRPDGKYDYELRYDEGPKDREWMENNDKIYLRQLLESGKLREKEPAVWYLYVVIDKAHNIDIGGWWVNKLASLRQQGLDIAIILEQAEIECNRFIAFSLINLKRSFEQRKQQIKEIKDRDTGKEQHHNPT